MAAPAVAHHSFSEFDQRRLIEVSGTLTEVAWQNPHVRLRLKAVEVGKSVTWTSSATRSAFSRDSVSTPGR